ncbi:MAG: pilus assembly protein [Anaerolineales bacterium]|nr:pilus assembly protein [Anaerolineales bacterium]MCW5854646.1 pilus assembly protein [Anaerolineales bacterium]
MRNFLKKVSSGQGTLEFALVIPVLLLVIFAIFEGARAVFIYQSISTASREAARLGSSTQYYLNCTAIRDKALEYAGVARSTAGDIDIYYVRDDLSKIGDCGSVTAAQIETGHRIVVEVTGYFDPAAAIPLMRIPQMTFNSTTRRTILKSVEVGQTLPAGTELAQLYEVSALR